MKMEFLSVQNHHIQRQFGVINSTNVKKDWTSSLTLPSTRITPSSTTLQESTTHTHSSNNATVYCSFHSPIEHFDIVGVSNQQHNLISSTHNTSGYSHIQSNYDFDMETASAACEQSKGVINTTSSAYYTCNNNLLYCSPNSTPVESTTTSAASNNAPYHSSLTDVPVAALTPSPVSSNLSTPTEATEHFHIAQDEIDSAAIDELSLRLQAELRTAKSRHLSCTEVSLPWDLTPRIAADIIKTSEREPCGLRGCAIFIDFEDETGSARRIAFFKIDPNTVSTFELFLTLKQNKGGWTSLLPQFLKNLTRSSTILISPNFTLSKHKLYACE